MTPVALLFLDVDGVLNTGYEDRLTSRCMTELCTLFGEIRDLKIVLSTSWRMDENRMGILEKGFEVAGISAEQRAGKTPDFVARREELGQGLRGYEILGWLQTEPNRRNWDIRSYAVIDDHPETVSPPVQPTRVVATQFERGWEPVHTRKLREILAAMQ